MVNTYPATATLLIVIIMTCICRSTIANAFIDATKYLQLQSTTGGHLADGREIMSREILGEISDHPQLDYLLNYALNLIPNVNRDTADPLIASKRRGPTTTMRPYHGQIPRPTILTAKSTS